MNMEPHTNMIFLFNFKSTVWCCWVGFPSGKAINFPTDGGWRLRPPAARQRDKTEVRWLELFSRVW